jgi:hypothetical protein
MMIDFVPLNFIAAAVVDGAAAAGTEYAAVPVSNPVNATTDDCLERSQLCSSSDVIC